MSEIRHCGAFRLYRDSKSKYWQVRAEDAPRDPLWKSTGEENETLALKKAKQIYADWANISDLKPGEQILFKDLWQEYLEDRATFAKPTTMKRLTSVGQKHLIPAFGNRFLHEIQGLWPKFVRTQKMKRPDSDLFNERKYTVSALQYGYDHNLIDKVPPIQVIKRKKKSIRIYTDDEIKRLIAGCGDDHELRLNILLGFCMGMRHGEIAKLEVRDLDFGNDTLHVRDTKTYRDRSIAINPAVLQPLIAQVARVDQTSEFLFPQVHNPGRHKDQRVFDKAWQDLKRRTGIRGTFHGLRHACANRLKQSHVPVAVAAAYLGMSIRMYDATYGQLGTEDTRVAAGVVRLPAVAEKVDPVESAVENSAGGRDDRSKSRPAATTTSFESTSISDT